MHAPAGLGRGEGGGRFGVGCTFSRPRRSKTGRFFGFKSATTPTDRWQRNGGLTLGRTFGRCATCASRGGPLIVHATTRAINAILNRISGADGLASHGRPIPNPAFREGGRSRRSSLHETFQGRRAAERSPSRRTERIWMADDFSRSTRRRRHRADSLVAQDEA